jgi:hypothetical protein
MYDPETKRQSAMWLSPNKPKVQKVRMQKSRVKTLLTAFFYAKGIIHHEFLPEKQIVNGKFNKEVIKRLIVLVHRVRPEFQESGSRSPSFWRNEGSPCYPIHPTTLI